VTPVTHATPSIHAAVRVHPAENDGLGDQFLFGISERRVVVMAVVTHERVRELVAGDGNLRVDGLRRVDRQPSQLADLFMNRP